MAETADASAPADAPERVRFTLAASFAGTAGLRDALLTATSHRRPARLGTLAGTPASRSAATLMPLRLAHEAATFTNAS